MEKCIPNDEYRTLVHALGGPKRFIPEEDNFFVVFNHKSERYDYFTVNDHFQAPERLYLTEDVAIKVTNHLNYKLNAPILKKFYDHLNFSKDS